MREGIDVFSSHFIFIVNVSHIFSKKQTLFPMSVEEKCFI